MSNQQKALKERELLLAKAAVRRDAVLAAEDEDSRQRTPRPERVYRVTLTIIDAPEVPAVAQILPISELLTFLSTLWKIRHYSSVTWAYKDISFATADPNLMTYLTNALLAGSIAAYRVQLPETELGN